MMAARHCCGCNMTCSLLANRCVARRCVTPALAQHVFLYQPPLSFVPCSQRKDRASPFGIPLLQNTRTHSGQSLAGLHVNRLLASLASLESLSSDSDNDFSSKTDEDGASLVEIKGAVEKVIFYDSKTDYCVLSVLGLDSEGSSPEKVAGNMPKEPKIGSIFTFEGHWETHKKHGRFLKSEYHERKEPPDGDESDGMVPFLEMVPGIGKAIAERIVSHFGADTREVVYKNPERLLEVNGIGDCVVRSCIETFERQALNQTFHHLIRTLNRYGVTNQQCRKIANALGDGAVEKVQENPYCLVKIRGFGFETVDRIALRMGFASDSEMRLEACVFDALNQLERQGSTAILQTALVNRMREYGFTEVAKTKRLLSEMVQRGDVIERATYKREYVQLLSTADAEEKIAASLSKLAEARPSIPFVKAEQVECQTLSIEQQEAISIALSHKVSILTGGPGTGKTATLKALVHVLENNSATVHLATPTGAAAEKLTQSTGKSAKTIHRLLGYNDGQFEYNATSKLSADFVVVDEASMLDTHLAMSLICAIPEHCHILFVGDVDQLPSVGPGNVLEDIISSRRFPVSRLQFTFRQNKMASDITRYAHKVNSGDTSLPKICQGVDDLSLTDSFQFLEVRKVDDVPRVVTSCSLFMSKNLHLDHVADIQILVPQHKGDAGRNRLNEVFQEEVNSEQFVTEKFKLGDKIMQTRNDYDKEVFNGNTGRVIRCDKGPDGQSSLIVNFNDREVPYDEYDTADLTLGYASTIHKSQGSEYSVVVVVLMEAHYYKLLQRKLLYTAITRGKQHVIVVGNPAAYQDAVRNTNYELRNNLLKARIQDKMQE